MTAPHPRGTRLIWWLIVVGLLLRLIVAYVVAPGQGLAEDLRLFVSWAQSLAEHGPGTYYATAEFADYPPGYLYILWAVGLVGQILSGVTGQPLPDVLHGLIKLPAILADLGVAYLLYRTARRWHGERSGLIAAGLFLFIPFTWYESALWGQVDAVGALFLLAAVVLIVEGWSEASVAMAVFAVVMKPQYGVGLLILIPILLARHLLHAGSGPVPKPMGWSARVDGWLGGLFTRRQGWVRLFTSTVTGVVVLFLALAPFDVWRNSPMALTNLPAVDHVLGYIGLVAKAADHYHVLTVNAFNVWALVGPTPLTQELGGSFLWTFDSLQLIGPIEASWVGFGAFVIVAGLVGLVLLRRNDRAAVLVGFTVLAMAFYALPTRVHERYEYPVLVVGALLAAASVGWRLWYIAVGVIGTINLHAVLTLAQPGFATPGLIGAPHGDLARSPMVVAGASIAMSVLFLALLWYWVQVFVVRREAAAVVTRVIVTPPAVVPAPSEDPPWYVPHAEMAAPTDGDEPVRRTAVPAAAALARARDPDVESVGPLAPLAALLQGPARRLGRRLYRDPLPTDRTVELEHEPRGRLDRRDLIVVTAIILLTLGTRLYRLDTPRTMYFDELYYPSTAAEFLQAWRYDLPTNIFEWTHPHVSKYAMAAGLALLGNDRVTGTGTTGETIRDATFQPAAYDPTAPGGFRGDRLVMVTGSSVLVAPHADLGQFVDVPIDGAAVVATDRAADQVYVGTDDGRVVAVDGPAFDAALLEPTLAPQPRDLIQLGAPVVDLWVAAQDRLIARTGDGRLHAIDATTGVETATLERPDIRGLTPIVVPDRTVVVISTPAGLERLDAVSFESLGVVELDAAPRGLILVDGSQFGWANQDTLPIPTLYVALEGQRVEAVQVTPEGELRPFDTFAMPGDVTDVRWDEPSNMAHVLGHTADGRPTIYVVEPHTNAVFADAVLPFEPVAWTLDAQPDTPQLDRQRGLAFAENGTYAVVDIGSHATAWRLPGVLAGAIAAGLMYLLARILFRRRSVGLFLAGIMALDGLLLTQGRIAMNDNLLAFFIVAAFTLLAALMHGPARGTWARVGMWLGLPLVGLLLGLAFGTKWVGAYAIGGAVLLVLARSRIGRMLALVGLVNLTAILGWQAVAGQPPNLTFLLIMLGVTVTTALVIVRRPDPAAKLDRGETTPSWLDPSEGRALPFIWAMVCLTVIPIAIYVISYVPWVFSANGSPQLFAGWPAGHLGQTFLDLQAQMYAYHNDLRTIHGQSSPWWAWPFGLRPIWGYYDTFSDASQATILLTGNPVLLWMAVPGAAFGAWQAWRRRSASLAFVLIAFFALWLSWARIDRVAFNYHWYTALPFAYLLLAYFLAEVWHGPSRRTWGLAKVGFAIVLLAPALLWLLRGPLCAVAGTAEINPTSFQCTRDTADLTPLILGWLIGALALGWLVLRSTRPDRFIWAVFAAAGAVFVGLLPVLTAWPTSNGLPLVYQGLLPTWDISFRFTGNQAAPVHVPLLGLGPLMIGLLTVILVWLAVRVSSDGQGLSLAGELAALRQLPATWRSRSDARGTPVDGRVEDAPVAASAIVADRPKTDDRDASLEERHALETMQETSLVAAVGIPVGLFVVVLAGYWLINNGRPAIFDYFVPLADAFLHRQTGLGPNYAGLFEVVPGTNGLYNVVYPPMPAVLLIPLVAVFGIGFPQAVASMVLGAINVVLMSFVLTGIGVTGRRRVGFSLFFAFGTIVWFSAQAGTSWHFAHVAAMAFTLLVILACQRDWPTWFIGLLFASAVLCRLPVLGLAPFLIAYLADRVAFERRRHGVPFGAPYGARLIALPDDLKPTRLIQLALPMAISAGILFGLYFVYNAVRFGSPLENGYALIPGLLDEPQYSEGFLSFAYIPRQLAAMFTTAPVVIDTFPFLQPPWLGGLSILLTTPVFLWAFKSRRLDWFNIGCWGAVILTLVPILMHGDAGGEEFGYRYAQDMYPFLFLLTVRGLGPRISPLAWVAIAISVVVNLWGMAATYLQWFAR